MVRVVPLVILFTFRTAGSKFKYADAPSTAWLPACTFTSRSKLLPKLMVGFSGLITNPIPLNGVAVPGMAVAVGGIGVAV